jgi:hypothetical protein
MHSLFHKTAGTAGAAGWLMTVNHIHNYAEGKALYHSF